MPPSPPSSDVTFSARSSQPLPTMMMVSALLFTSAALFVLHTLEPPEIRYVANGIAILLGLVIVAPLRLTSYTLTATHLRVFNGILTRQTALTAIESVSPGAITSPGFKANLSGDPLYVTASQDYNMLISPESDEKFLLALLERAPHLARTGPRTVARRF